MITFEKMLFLKSMDLFKRVKDDILLGVAAVLEEERVAAGQKIIKKDEFGTTMYMIVTGKVKVHDADHVIKEMGSHDIFGELAALSPSRRIADVSALEETLLLKINSATIYGLMEIQIELAKGIIEVLCERVRSIASELEQARSGK